MKNVVLLGSTGSIGTSTVKVAEDLPDQIRLIGLAAGGNSELLLDQTRRHQPAVISIGDPAKAIEELKEGLRLDPANKNLRNSLDIIEKESK